MTYYVTRRSKGERLTIAEAETWAKAADIVSKKSEEDEEAWYFVSRTSRLNWKQRELTNA